MVTSDSPQRFAAAGAGPGAAGRGSCSRRRGRGRAPWSCGCGPAPRVANRYTAGGEPPPSAASHTQRGRRSRWQSRRSALPGTAVGRHGPSVSPFRLRAFAHSGAGERTVARCPRLRIRAGGPTRAHRRARGLRNGSDPLAIRRGLAAGSACFLMGVTDGFKREKWWARQGSNLRPKDYEFVNKINALANSSAYPKTRVHGGEQKNRFNISQLAHVSARRRSGVLVRTVPPVFRGFDRNR